MEFHDGESTHSHTVHTKEAIDWLGSRYNYAKEGRAGIDREITVVSNPLDTEKFECKWKGEIEYMSVRSNERSIQHYLYKYMGWERKKDELSLLSLRKIVRLVR